MNLVCDLGTANFRAAVISSNEILNEPCVVAYDKSGKTIIGGEAYQMIGRNPNIIDIVTPIEAGAAPRSGR
jgi:rod shape-determining protein MreB and related proteins